MKNFFFICLVSLFFSSTAFTVERTFFTPLSPGSSARMVGIGNIEGMSKLSDNVFQNPASLHTIDTFSVSFFTTKFMGEVLYLNGSFAVRLPYEMGVLGFGMMDLSVRDIPKTTYSVTAAGDEIYSISNYFDYQNTLYKLSYQLSANDFFHYGLSGSYYSVKFDTVSGDAYNMDFGLYFDTENFDFSMVMKNIMTGQDIIYEDTDTSIPFCVSDCNSIETFLWNNSEGQQESLSLETIYSVKYTLRHFSFLGQFKTLGEDRDLSVGYGVIFNPTFMPFLSLYGGNKTFPLVRSSAGETSIVTESSQAVGVGLDLMGLNFDYAYEKSDHVEYKHKHYFSFGIMF